jgi:hypothetical protein
VLGGELDQPRRYREAETGSRGGPADKLADQPAKGASEEAPIIKYTSAKHSGSARECNIIRAATPKLPAPPPLRAQSRSALVEARRCAAHLRGDDFGLQQTHGGAVTC